MRTIHATGVTEAFESEAHPRASPTNGYGLRVAFRISRFEIFFSAWAAVCVCVCEGPDVAACGEKGSGVCLLGPLRSLRAGCACARVQKLNE